MIRALGLSIALLVLIAGIYLRLGFDSIVQMHDGGVHFKFIKHIELGEWLFDPLTGLVKHFLEFHHSHRFIYEGKVLSQIVLIGIRQMVPTYTQAIAVFFLLSLFLSMLPVAAILVSHRSFFEKLCSVFLWLFYLLPQMINAHFYGFFPVLLSTGLIAVALALINEKPYLTGFLAILAGAAYPDFFAVLCISIFIFVQSRRSLFPRWILPSYLALLFGSVVVLMYAFRIKSTGSIEMPMTAYWIFFAATAWIFTKDKLWELSFSRLLVVIFFYFSLVLFGLSFVHHSGPSYYFLKLLFLVPILLVFLLPSIPNQKSYQWTFVLALFFGAWVEREYILRQFRFAFSDKRVWTQAFERYLEDTINWKDCERSERLYLPMIQNLPASMIFFIGNSIHGPNLFASGYAMHIPKLDRNLLSRPELFETVAVDPFGFRRRWAEAGLRDECLILDEKKY